MEGFGNRLVVHCRFAGFSLIEYRKRAEKYGSRITARTNEYYITAKANLFYLPTPLIPPPKPRPANPTRKPLLIIPAKPVVGPSSPMGSPPSPSRLSSCTGACCLNRILGPSSSLAAAPSSLSSAISTAKAPLCHPLAVIANTNLPFFLSASPTTLAASSPGNRTSRGVSTLSGASGRAISLVGANPGKRTLPRVG